MNNGLAGTLGNPIDLRDRKICIAYPSPDLVHVDFCNSLLQLVTQNSRFVKIGITNSMSSRIAQNRNIIVANARLMGDVTDILWIDSDTKFPITGIMKLLSHEKDIVCASTCKRLGANKTIIAVPEDFSSIQPYQKLVKMKQIGFPFMLTSMKVFDKIDKLGFAPDKVYFAEPPRWMMKERGWEVEGVEGLVAEDEYWCYLARKAGFDIWCDMELSMEIGHIGLDCSYIKNPEQIPQANVDEVL